jgi:ribosomal protein S18 acetylase RimI-like enzyme
MNYQVKEIKCLKIDFLLELANEAKDEGHDFVQKTIDDWNSGTNDFSKESELLFGVFYKTDCIGIGGLNIDPYTTDRKTGRIRHLYVSNIHRKKGIGKLILNKLIESSKGSFDKLRLYTENSLAISFYENYGFKKSSANKESHYIEVKKV